MESGISYPEWDAVSSLIGDNFLITIWMDIQDKYDIQIGLIVNLHLFAFWLVNGHHGHSHWQTKTTVNNSFDSFAGPKMMNQLIRRWVPIVMALLVTIMIFKGYTKGNLIYTCAYLWWLPCLTPCFFSSALPLDYDLDPDLLDINPFIKRSEASRHMEHLKHLCLFCTKYTHICDPFKVCLM